MKKVLVTGGAGYIGSHTVVELVQAGYEPIVIDNFSASDRTLLKGIEKITGKPLNFHEGDCRDKDFLTRLFNTQGPIQSVMHFAAYKSVGESVQKPLEYHENNIMSLIVLLEVMRDVGVKDFIFSSSCTVYGQPDVIPVDENAPFKRAESPYGATKQICERILEDVFSTGYRIVSLRYFNPIGAHPSTLIGEMPLGTPNNLVPFITQAAAGLREKLTVFGNDYNTPDGYNIRDFIHIVDLAKAHVKALNYLEQNSSAALYDAFNLGTGIGASVREAIDAFVRATGVQVPYIVGPRRPGDIEKVFANPKKANTILKWKTSLTMDEAMLHAWQWQKKLND